MPQQPRMDADPAQLAVKAREVADVLKALAHPQRLLVLCRLSAGEANVSALQEVLGAEQAVVSHLLAKLRREALVVAERRGQQVFYALADARVAKVLEVLTATYCEEMPR